jgi:hypothetical protein
VSGTPRRDSTRGIQVRAAGSWSPQPPPYLSAIPEREFVALKEEWLKRTMMIGSLLASHRVISYFLTDALNWATMDCWPSHETLAGLSGLSSKTVQRSILLMEQKNLLAVYRRAGSSHPLRYSPLYLIGQDTGVRQTGHPCRPEVDTGVQQPFLTTIKESSVKGCRREQRTGSDATPPLLSFERAQRGWVETQIAPLLGGFDVLFRLAAIHDDIITRLCEAHYTGQLGERQIRSAKLAAKQTHTG